MPRSVKRKTSRKRNPKYNTKKRKLRKLTKKIGSQKGGGKGFKGSQRKKSSKGSTQMPGYSLTRMYLPGITNSGSIKGTGPVTGPIIPKKQKSQKELKKLQKLLKTKSKDTLATFKELLKNNKIANIVTLEKLRELNLNKINLNKINNNNLLKILKMNEIKNNKEKKKIKNKIEELKNAIMYERTTEKNSPNPNPNPSKTKGNKSKQQKKINEIKKLYNKSNDKVREKRKQKILKMLDGNLRKNKNISYLKKIDSQIAIKLLNNVKSYGVYGKPEGYLNKIRKMQKNINILSRKKRNHLYDTFALPGNVKRRREQLRRQPNNPNNTYLEPSPYSSVGSSNSGYKTLKSLPNSVGNYVYSEVVPKEKSETRKSKNNNGTYSRMVHKKNNEIIYEKTKRQKGNEKIYNIPPGQKMTKNEIEGINNGEKLFPGMREKVTKKIPIRKIQN